MTPWNQVTIIGIGLIGGSMGLALKKAGLARQAAGARPRADAGHPAAMRQIVSGGDGG